MNHKLKESPVMITLISVLGTLIVRLGIAWNWLRIISSGRLGINCVEPWGSGTRELVVSERDLSEIGCEDERVIKLADNCMQC